MTVTAASDLSDAVQQLGDAVDVLKAAEDELDFAQKALDDARNEVQAKAAAFFAVVAAGDPVRIDLGAAMRAAGVHCA